tara:strand:- start:5531 stop:7150 length:1620 start_codon:yes stop_codon:yes gene_type:complete
LEKDGEMIPITALDKYGKVIDKCQKVLKEFPESRYAVDANLLMAKSRYYRKDYENALIELNQVEKNGTNDQIQEARYWQALCKWKKGNVQTAINELENLLVEAYSKNIQAKCHLSLSDLSKELNDHEKSLFHLNKGANLTQSRDERGMIYARLAELAYNRNEYELAENAYINVIAHSLSKEKVEKAHLQILKIYRAQKKYKSASKKIKSMLVDEKFKRIAGNLELELVQLYRSQGELSEIETRLETIVNEYQRTPISAEAYFQLGQIYTSEKWNLDKAKESFDAVSKESSKSIYSPMAKSRSKAIEIYRNSQLDIATHNKILNLDTNNVVKEDSLNLKISLLPPKKSIPELYYQIADLEAFTFRRYDKAIEYLNKIIAEHSESNFKPKSMFALIFIYNATGDTLESQKYEKKLLSEFPTSEYSAYFDMDTIGFSSIQNDTYRKAESEAKMSPLLAVSSYKLALSMNRMSDLAAPAMYSIGYYYDQETVIDSALKYYKLLIEDYPDSEQGKVVSERIRILNDIIAISNNDTLMINKQEEN